MPRLTNNEIDNIVDGLTAHVQNKIELIKSERISIVKQVIESRYSKELKVLITRKDAHLNHIGYAQLRYMGKYNSVCFEPEIVAPNKHVEITGANAQKLIDLDKKKMKFVVNVKN
jgi:hypothetical protein